MRGIEYSGFLGYAQACPVASTPVYLAFAGKLCWCWLGLRLLCVYGDLSVEVSPVLFDYQYVNLLDDYFVNLRTNIFLKNLEL